jgi:hypothetical protein
MAGHASKLKDRFLTLEKENSKVETSSSKMNYVPKKFTSYSTSPATPTSTTAPAGNPLSSSQQQQQPKPKAAGSPTSNGPSQQQKLQAQTYVGGLLTTVAATSNSGSASTAAEKCFICEKTVYAMEKIEADKKLYHKQCFKCTSCNCPLK